MTALIFALIKENYVSEQGARMVSMDGASKNAADMIDKLTLSFNRMRQAVSPRNHNLSRRCQGVKTNRS